MKSFSVTAATLAVLALLAVPARAQAPASADSAAVHSLRKGAWSISLEAPLSGGTSQAGVWKMVDDRTNVGVTVGLNVGVGNAALPSDALVATDEFTVRLGLGARRYAMVTKSVAPFVTGTLYGSGSHIKLSGEDEGPEQTVTTWGAGVLGGVGAEWFPVRRVSVSGTTGINLRYTRGTSEASGREFKADELSLGTFTSGLALQIYF